jgi:O-antigen/teichoic acid export membrane protein
MPDQPCNITPRPPLGVCFTNIPNRRSSLKRISPDCWAAIVLAILVAIFLFDVLFGGKVLLPVDNLYLYPPWQEHAAEQGIGIPNNHLIGDAILQNISWKAFARNSLAQGQIPLWNPYLLSGVPFLAAGQYAVLYPPGVLFYVMPLPYAYGWFIGLHLFLAGLFMYIFLRIIQVNRWGATFGAVAFAFCGFLLTSFQWPMVVSTAAWLPLLLVAVELVIRNSEEGENRGLLWFCLGATVVAMQFLAGHMEISFYVLFSAGFFAAARLAAIAWKAGWRRSMSPAITLLAMVGLGIGLAALQIMPFVEAIGANFRSGYVSFQEVIGYAMPKDQAIGFLMPDFFGNPSHHTYLDLNDFQSKLVGDNALGKPTDPPHTIFWGRKNYVEGAVYIGILPLILGALALLRRRNRYTWIFAIFGALAISLAFGAPWYWVFFRLPGFDQLHTPFRWIFPYMVCAIVLGSIGAGYLAEESGRSARALRWLTLLAGGSFFTALGAGLLWRSRALSLVGAWMERADRLKASFSDGAMLFSYQGRNIFILGLMLLASAGVLWIAGRRWRLPGAQWLPLAPALAIFILAADVMSYSYSFNTRIDPKPLTFIPPAIAALPQEDQPYRIVSFGDEDILPPNSGMLFELQDVRGYDTIIPKQYAEYWSLMEDPHGLIYSKIHKLVRADSLQSPYFDLMNIKYILSVKPLNLPLVYDGPTKVYRNPRVAPRSYLSFSAESVTMPAESLARLNSGGFDPKQHTVLIGAQAGSLPHNSGPPVPARITLYSPMRVVVEADTPAPAVLVLLDSYFPGWEAKIDGKQAGLYRAQHTFRGVLLEPGRHVVEFEYKPISFRLGLMVSGLSAAALLLLAGWRYWRRRPPGARTGHVVQRVAKNTMAPMASNLLNKVVDLGFAAVMLRILSPANVGNYTFAIVLVGYFEIITNFGLNTLLTREVSRDRSQGNTYLSHTAILRLLLCLAAAPILALVLALWAGFIGLTPETIWAVVLLALALVPGNIATALSAVFYAHERMEYPAMVSVLTTFVKVALGVAALLAGYGIVGLAGIAVVTNVITMAIFIYLVPRHFFQPTPVFSGNLAKGILSTSWPLMLNHILATMFFRVDVLVMQATRTSQELGYYGTAYKFIDGLNVIPSTFTLALFPVLSRYATTARHSFLRAYTLAIKTLLLLAIPLAVGTALLAEELVLLVGGEQYLPHSVTALQLLIWFLPFSYVNSVTHYVLIALDRQRYLTVCFVAGAVFNLTANAILIPRHGYQGAAVVTVISELVLLVPFLWEVHRRLGSLPSLSLVWRPVVGAMVMGWAITLLRPVHPLLAVGAAPVIYGAVLLALRTFDNEDRAIFARLMGRR